LLLAGLGAVCFNLPVWAAESNPQAEELFARRVLPLLKSKCFACHGDDPADVRGELDLRSRKGLLQGGESGETSLVPGKPEQSSLGPAKSVWRSC
jgi:hypothetical protein